MRGVSWWKVRVWRAEFEGNEPGEGNGGVKLVGLEYPGDMSGRGKSLERESFKIGS